MADQSNHTIRKVTPDAVVTTVAGLAGNPGSADGIGSAALFRFPYGVATDSAGNIYVGDAGNQTIRKVTPERVVTTLAGLAGIRANLAGTGTEARLYGPSGVAIDSSGNLYVADMENHGIRLGSSSLADTVTIDAPTGEVGALRQLDTSPQTGASWSWSLIRRPANSTASLSSTSIRNPTFTPDVAGLYRFRLIASGDPSSSITTVDLTATAAE